MLTKEVELKYEKQNQINDSERNLQIIQEETLKKKLKNEQQKNQKLISKQNQLQIENAQLQEKLARLCELKKEGERRGKGNEPLPSLPPLPLPPPMKHQPKAGYERQCIMCLDEEASHVFVPCGHMVYCDDCVEERRKDKKKRIMKCPICRGDMKSILRVYLKLCARCNQVSTNHIAALCGHSLYCKECYKIVANENGKPKKSQLPLCPTCHTDIGYLLKIY